MKKIVVVVTLLLSVVGKAQLGVKVASPLTDLHINGGVQVVKDFKVGGSDVILGNAGTEGQFLSSKGIGIAPEWVTISIPVILPGSFSMTNSVVLVDKIGVELDKGANKRQYVENESIKDVPAGDVNAVWTVFPELNSIIHIDKGLNKVNFTIQTMAHLSSKMKPDSKAIPNFTYAIGVFVGGKLKSVKPFTVSGASMTFTVVTMIATIENLELGDHTVEVAVIPRLKEADYEGNLSIGKPNKDSTNISDFMARTSMKIDIFEVLN